MCMQALSVGLHEEAEGGGQVAQLRCELQQRSGQVQKLHADLEFNQEELQDLQRHCQSLEVLMTSSS